MGELELGYLFVRFGVSLGLGLLVGLQRERSQGLLAGFRTFPLVTVLGTLCAFLSLDFGGVVLALGFVGLAALLVAGNLIAARGSDFDPGLTTEVALLLMFGTGALAARGPLALAIALGGGTAVLLQFKQELHGFAGRISDRDVKAIMQFALVSLVILPVLPDQVYGPYSVLNPRQIWWMVVLIVGVSLFGYLAFKRLAPHTGGVVGGVLGGLVSSTATTVSYARRGAQGASRVAAMVIVISSTVVFVRVLFEIAVVATDSFWKMAPPIAAMMGVLIVIAGALCVRYRRVDLEVPEPENPSELGAALVFGLLYAGVLLAIAAMKERFGDLGLYVVAIVSGLTDMDAITLSTAQLVNGGRLETEAGWRAILVAAMSNLVFKGATVAVLGDRRLLTRVLALFGLALLAGVAILVWWPQ